MTDPALSRYLVRAALAKAQAIAWETWNNAWVERITPPPGEVISLVNTQSAADTTFQAKLVAQLPGPETFAQIEETIERLGSVARTMMAEDRAFVAQVRIAMYDAMVALRKGELDDTYAHLKAAHKRLDWIVNGRKRDSTHMDRRIRDHHIYDQLKEIISELALLVERIDRANVPLAVS